MTKIEFRKDQTVLFIGDSITDCNRRELPYAPYGWGYVHHAALMLKATYPHLNLNIENRGIGGDTTRALLWRWNRDCLSLKPGVLSIMIGINDLWRKFGNRFETQRMYVDPDEYKQNLTELLQTAKDQCGSQLVLMEPFMFCDDPENSMLKELPDYIETVRTLADRFGALLVPVHTNYVNLSEKPPAHLWADDTVHPSEWAHAWIAKQWLDTVLG